MKAFTYNMDFVRSQSSKELFNVVSLFAGGGGSSTGYRLAGGKVLAINEFIPAAQESYAKNYPDTYIFKQDVRLLTGQDILNKLSLKKGELDILDGSPPCSSFSTAGLREKGWGKEKKYSDSSQRTDDLFFEFSRILKEVQPKVFICENVKGITMGAAANLLGSEQIDLFGECKNTIYHTLCDAGYKVRYKVLDASDYCVPQARERTIFIGIRNDIDKEISYPKKLKEKITVEEAIKDLIPDEFNTLSEMQLEIYDFQKYGESMFECGKRIGRKIGGTTRHKSHKTKPSNTITTSPEIWHYEQKRTLAINELIVLSSFPSDYYLGKTFSKKWERLGRAVPPLLMCAIAKHIYKTILKQ
jgi:DNA (cytosine-5)-methyltransferase 1